MTSVKDSLSHEWMPELRKLHTRSYYSYPDCETAVFNKLFGNTWRIVNKTTEDDYEGETSIELELSGEWKNYKFSYGWGSCGGCDTLEGDGEEAACQMIYEQLKKSMGSDT